MSEKPYSLRIEMCFNDLKPYLEFLVDSFCSVINDDRFNEKGSYFDDMQYEVGEYLLPLLSKIMILLDEIATNPRYKDRSDHSYGKIVFYSLQDVKTGFDGFECDENGNVGDPDLILSPLMETIVDGDKLFGYSIARIDFFLKDYETDVIVDVNGCLHDEESGVTVKPRLTMQLR